MVPATAARNHLRSLVKQGVTIFQMSHTIYLTERTLGRIKLGKVKMVQKKTEKAILSLSVGQFVLVMQDNTEAREHLLWLQSKGYGSDRIAQVCGVNRDKLRRIRKGQTKKSYLDDIEKILAVHLEMFAGRVA
jgi:hypothetical protein